MSTPITVIFDNDGIIVDTEPLHYEARRAELAQYGITLTVEDYVRDWMSRHISVGLTETLRRNGKDSASFSPTKIASDITNRYNALRAQDLRLVKGFHDLFTRLSLQCVFSVASTQPRDSVVEGLRRLFSEAEFSLFKVIISGENVKRNKPAPDVYLEAVRQLGADPCRCVAVEDSVPGVQSAKSAGIECIGRANPFTGRSCLETAGAVVCDRYAEVSPRVLERILMH